MTTLAVKTNQPWLMDERSLHAMYDGVRSHGFGPMPVAEVEARKEAAAKRLKKVSGKVGVIRVEGVIEQKMSMWSYYFGGCSTEQVGETLDQMLADKSIEAILMEIDSPGGSVYGVEELGDKIFAGRAIKPIYAIANSMAASAAYWAGSAATQLIVTPGGDVGSVGVYMLHWDDSGFYEQIGSVPTLIKAGKYKAEGNTFEPLSDEAKANYQFEVDAIYDKFTKAVARGRGTTQKDVKDNYGQGRTLMSAQAKAAGMVDRIATLDQLIQELTGGSGSASSNRADSITQEQRRMRKAWMDAK